MTPVDLIIPDAGPLISLAHAGRLDLIEVFSRPVAVLDVVRLECLKKPESPDHEAMVAWFHSNANAIRIIETPIRGIYEQALEDEVSGRGRHATRGLTASTRRRSAQAGLQQPIGHPSIDPSLLHVRATCKESRIFFIRRQRCAKNPHVRLRGRPTMFKPSYAIPDLPPPGVEETPAVLRALAQAHRHLAELKGRAASIPNQGILIDTLALQEAKASSEIENIVTTQDELFQASAFPENPASPAAKEVARYADALRQVATQTIVKRGETARG